MKKFVFPFILIITVILLSACAPSSGVLAINDTWARSAFTGDNGAVYFVIENGTDKADALISASTDVASSAETHMTMVNSQDVVTMQMQDAVQVPAGEDIPFEPGGLHIMLVNLTRDLKVGDTITLTLQFEKAGEITLQVEVKEQP